MDMNAAVPAGGVMKLARMLSVLLLLIGSYFMIMRPESAFSALCATLASLAIIGVVALLMQIRWRTIERTEGARYFRAALGCMILLLVEYSALMFFYITRP